MYCSISCIVGDMYIQPGDDKSVEAHMHCKSMLLLGVLMLIGERQNQEPLQVTVGKVGALLQRLCLGQGQQWTTLQRFPVSPGQTMVRTIVRQSRTDCVTGCLTVWSTRLSPLLSLASKADGTDARTNRQTRPAILYLIMYSIPITCWQFLTL
jgi:hypothetical protein